MWRKDDRFARKSPGHQSSRFVFPRKYDCRKKMKKLLLHIFNLSLVMWCDIIDTVPVQVLMITPSNCYDTYSEYDTLYSNSTVQLKLYYDHSVLYCTGS